MGASFTTGYAYIADISPPEKRVQNFGILGSAFGFGFIIGPVIGGVLGQYGSRAPFLAAVALTLINWLFGFFILPESLTLENRRKFEWQKANPIGSLINLKRYPMIIGLGYALFSISTQSWMMFVFLIPYCLGGIAMPPLQGIMSS